MSGISIKITLENTHPPVWRRVILPENISFAGLHEVIQTVFGWENAHLHIFESPGKSYEIVMDEEEATNDDMLEAETPVGAVLEQEKWIRYVYDFGDDWKHKILFEKKVPEYNGDTATVIKAKGNNYKEDSGGIWSAEPVEESYSLDEVNKRLQTMHFKEVQMSEENQNMMTEKAAYQSLKKEFGKLLRESAEKFLEKLDRGEVRPKTISKIEKEVEDWADFCAGEDHAKICRKASVKTRKGFLHDLNEKRLAEYCKYLQILNPGETSDARVSAIAGELKEHPEYDLYILDRENVTELKRISELPLEKSSQADYMTIMLGIVLGLLSIQIPEGSQAAYIFLADDFKEWLSGIEAMDWRASIRESADKIEKAEKMLLRYNMLDLDTFYGLYNRQWKMDLTKTEFLRYIYWGGSFKKKFQTVYRMDNGKAYAIEHGLDGEKCLLDEEKYVKDLPYKIFTDKEIRETTGEISDSGVWWNVIGDYIERNGVLVSCDSADVVEDIFYEVLNGCGMEEVYAVIRSCVARNQLLIEEVSLWQAVVQAVMETELPMLHGYSRKEYEQYTRKNGFLTGVWSGIEEKKAVKQNTHLIDMPHEIQEKIYHIFGSGTEEEQVKALDRIRKELSVSNDELDGMLAVCYLGIRKYFKANSILEQLADRTEDGSVHGLMDRITDRLERISEEGLYNLESEIPYQRAEKKIGRNDPCPCGSGKKYKKCCGR